MGWRVVPPSSGISTSTYGMKLKLTSDNQKYFLTKGDHWWRHHFSHVTCVQFTDQKQNEEQIPYLRFFCYYIDFKLCQICWGDKRFTNMTTSWQSRDLDTIYRCDRKWGPDFVSQVLYALLTWTLTDMLGWHKIWIYDIIMFVMWLKYNLQTR